MKAIDTLSVMQSTQDVFRQIEERIETFAAILFDNPLLGYLEEIEGLERELEELEARLAEAVEDIEEDEDERDSPEDLQEAIVEARREIADYTRLARQARRQFIRYGLKALDDLRNLFGKLPEIFDQP